MPTLEQISKELLDSMKQKDAVRTSTLRMLVSALRNKEVEKKKVLAEADVLDVIQSEAKRRKESKRGDQIRQKADGGWKNRRVAIDENAESNRDVKRESHALGKRFGNWQAPAFRQIEPAMHRYEQAEPERNRRWDGVLQVLIGAKHHPKRQQLGGED